MNLQENVQRFADKIPSTLKMQGDEMVKDILTRGAAGAPTYSYIDDARNISAEQAERSVKALERELGENPTEQELRDFNVKVAQIQNRAAGERSTPKSNTYDYMVEKLLQIYRLTDGDQTSYGFPVTPAMKQNIMAGLGKMFDMFDPKGIYKSFFMGGRFSKERPTLPRKNNGKIDWELFNDMFLLTRQKASTPETIQRAMAAYNPDQEGSFSALFMNTARLRYKDAFRAMKVHKASANDPDAALRQDASASTGDVSSDDYVGDKDGSSTLGDTIADPDSMGSTDMDLSGHMGPAFEEIGAWIKTNMKDGDYKAELFKGAFVDGKKPVAMSQEPDKYPLVAQGFATDKNKAKNALLRMRTSDKFQRAFKSIVAKHIPDLAGKDADMKGMSFNVNKQSQDSSFAKDAGAAGYSTASADDFEKDYYGGSRFDDEEAEDLGGNLVSLDDLDPDLMEGLLMERVSNRIKTLIAESLWSKFVG